MRMNGQGILGADSRGPRIGALIAAVVLVSSLSGCGGGGGSPSGPSGSGPTRRLLGQGNFTLADSAVVISQTGIADFFVVNITTNASGTLDVVVDWTFASNDLDLYLLRGSCNPLQVKDGVCGNAFALSESSTAKPERLSVTGLAPGSYTLVIGSIEGNTAESGTWQLFLTS